MTANLAEANQYAMVEKVVIGGDLAALSPKERLEYYNQICASTGLNPLTKPFEYIKLNNKLTLYAKRDATDQLRKIHGVSIKIVGREKVDDLYIVTAQATDKGGRTDEAVGAVNLQGLKGDMAANAIMKAETKAKRRVTLSIAGLGLLDETEVSTIPGAQTVPVDVAHTPTMITDDAIDESKVFDATVWFREMIDVDQLEENYQIVQAGWKKLNANEQMAVHEKLSDPIPGNKNKKLYRNALKEYLDYVPPEAA